MALAIDTQGVSKWFRHRQLGEVEILRDISLKVHQGEFVSVVGASGCGKTTFLRTIAGLVAPSSGRVLVGQQEVQGPSPSCAMVFQADRLLPWRNVVGNLTYGLEVQGAPKDVRARKAEELLEMVGLTEFRENFPHELSGGMRQRVNLARALAVDPQILLMDEPFAALDAQTREIMQAELLRIWRETRKTIVFVTHQIDEAVFLGDRVIVLSSRPGAIKTEIPVDLPRPRDLSVKRTAKFVQYVDQIWRLLEHDIVKGAR